METPTPSPNTYNGPAQQPVKQPRGWAKLVGGICLAVVAIVVQALVAVAGMMVFHQSPTDVPMLMVCEVASGIFALFAVTMLGGWLYARPNTRGIRLILHVAVVIVALDLFLSVGSVVGVVFGPEEQTISANWPEKVLMVAVLCLGVGMFEEGVFRGLLLQGLLARMGTTPPGVIAAILISSLAFGLMHVIPGADTTFDSLTVAQMALKTLQTGMLGVILAIVVMKTHSLWGAILFHALNDFLLMAPAVALLDELPLGDYVLTGDDGITLIGVYAVICALYLPSLMSAVREFKPVRAPQRGAFYRMRVPATPQPPETFTRTFE